MTPQEPIDPRPNENLGGEPQPAPAPAEQDAPPAHFVAEAPLRPRPSWQAKLLSVSFALFCLEVGAFLIVFPQQDSWNLNYFSGLSPWVQDVWDATYFRWAVSGVGVLNIYVAFLQIRNLFRY